MQPGMTAALATVWLAVAAGVVGAVTLRPFHLSDDQYSPASPRHHRVQRDQTDWRDHEPAEDQPLDLWIGPRRSIFAEDSSDLSRNVKRDFILDEPLKDVALTKQAHDWQKRLPNIAYTEFVADKVDYGEMPETLSRKVPPSDPDDPFVADDTFQDQGPGSVEIYKLDLSREKALLTATTPFERLPARNKSKIPKKIGHVNSKTKTTEIKSTVSPKTNHRQSNFFEEQRTETPLNNKDAFDIGGVPELQVGCEGLEASPSYKAKRSLREETAEESAKPQLDTLLDYDYKWYDDENYEETDELLKLKKLETTTSRIKSNRGDMDATLNSDHLDDSRRSDRLPVRGDLGESNTTLQQSLTNSSYSFNLKQRILAPINSTSEIGQNESPRKTDSKVKGHEVAKAKRDSVTSDDDSLGRRSGRRLLWLAEANTARFAGVNRKRAKRSTDWGFGEDEGVVSSNELQTINERRRQHDMRYHQDAWRRDQQQHGRNSAIDSIRQEYERLLEQKRREEEERRRRMQQDDRKTPSRWEEEERRRRDEMRRGKYEEYRRRTEHTSIPRTDDEEIRRRQMEELRRQETERNRTQAMVRRDQEERKRQEEERWRREESRRRTHDKWQEEEELKRQQEENAKRYKAPMSEEERKRRLQDEEMRRNAEERRRQEDERKRAHDEEIKRQEQYRSQQEAQRRREEEERKRASQENPTRTLATEDRRRLEMRRRLWSEKRRQQNGEERRRQQNRSENDVPSNLMHTGHRGGYPNDLEQHDRERRLREREERMREQKLREYIARNRPINVSRIPDRKSQEERRGYRPEQTAGSRVNVNRDGDEYRRRAEEQRRRQEEERNLQDYIRRNQPMNVPSRENQSIGRNWFDERRQIEEARRRGGYLDPGAMRGRGPSAPAYIDPRSSLEEVRRKQEEERRQAREQQQRHEAEERRKELARRQQQQREEEERGRLQQERRKEEVKREEEARREQSRRYEENRKRLEATRMQEVERREMLGERGRDGGQAVVDRTRQPETTRSPYQDPRLAEHRRKQDSRLIPSSLVRDEARWAIERERQEQARHETERRRQEESRIQRPETYTDQWQRQEIARLQALPVSARIIVRPDSSASPGRPTVISRGEFGNDIDFMGINPNREGVKVAQFPIAPTTRPPVRSPGPCVWAIVQCCSRNNNRLVKCFESMGCPGVSWDANPCRHSVMEAAKKEVLKFYAAAENQ